MGTIGGLSESGIILGRNPHTSQRRTCVGHPASSNCRSLPLVGMTNRFFSFFTSNPALSQKNATGTGHSVGSGLTRGCRTGLGSWRCPCRSLRLRSR